MFDKQPSSYLDKRLSLKTFGGIKFLKIFFNKRIIVLNTALILFTKATNYALDDQNIFHSQVLIFHLDYTPDFLICSFNVVKITELDYFSNCLQYRQSILYFIINIRSLCWINYLTVLHWINYFSLSKFPS